jgi:predicted transcriptional regulator
MKVKNIKMAIKSDRELFNEVKKVWKNLEKGGKVPKHEGIYFEDLDTMRKILTVERLKILKTIKKNSPRSIYELAKLIERDVKNTFDDVQFLAQVGLIELKKTKNGRAKTTPQVNYDQIVLEIPV